MNIIENPNSGQRFIKREKKVMTTMEVAKVEEMLGIGVGDQSIQTKKTKVIPGHEIFQKYYGMGSEKKNKMEDFADIYGADTIKKDKKRVEEVKKKQEKPTPSGIVLENIFYDLSEKLLTDEKSGNEIYSQLLSVFDDTMADSTRADVVLEIKNPKGEIKMKEIKRFGHRLPEEVVYILRHKGGPQGTRKGKRGYSRAAEKNWGKIYTGGENSLSPFLFYIKSYFSFLIVQPFKLNQKRIFWNYFFNSLCPFDNDDRVWFPSEIFPA